MARRSAAPALLACVIVIGLLSAGCGGSDDEDEAIEGDPSASTADQSTTDADAIAEGPDAATSEAEPPPAIEAGPKATFTGLPADEALASTPAVVVKISNNDDRSVAALVGLERADVVIEERIEDRATRFAAIFHSDLPDLVGPVRSARTTDLDLMRNLGNPILVFSGANIAVLRDLRDLALEESVVLVVNDDSETYHYRDADFPAPDNLFTDPSLVSADFREAAGAAQPVVRFRDAESDTRPASILGTGVTIEGRDTVSFVHHPTRGYVRVQDGVVHRTRTGEILQATNVVVMEVSYVQNADDQQSIDAVTVGSGPASVLIGGRRWEGSWERATADAPYTFRDVDGDEVLLEPGSTWLTLVPVGTYAFAVDADIAGLVAEVAG